MVTDRTGQEQGGEADVTEEVAAGIGNSQRSRLGSGASRLGSNPSSTWVGGFGNIP